MAILLMSILIGCQEPTPMQDWEEDVRSRGDTVAQSYQIESPQRFDPPPLYQHWWDEVDRCLIASQPDASFGEVNWYLYNSLVVDNHQVVGLWLDNQTILIKKDLKRSEIVVKHEMIHSQCTSCSHKQPIFHECVTD